MQKTFTKHGLPHENGKSLATAKPKRLRQTTPITGKNSASRAVPNRLLGAALRRLILTDTTGAS